VEIGRVLGGQLAKGQKIDCSIFHPPVETEDC
jgi:hypothetical protein